MDDGLAASRVSSLMGLLNDLGSGPLEIDPQTQASIIADEEDGYTDGVQVGQYNIRTLDRMGRVILTIDSGDACLFWLFPSRHLAKIEAMFPDFWPNGISLHYPALKVATG